LSPPRRRAGLHAGRVPVEAEPDNARSLICDVLDLLERSGRRDVTNEPSRQQLIPSRTDARAVTRL
jgi:hypothetical protein